MSEGLYFRQLLSGRDFAVGDPLAAQMVNFVYVVGDRESGEALLVDPAYRPAELVEVVEADGMKVIGALATHYHPDHVGGMMAGLSIAGIAELLDVIDVPVHVQASEVEWVTRCTGVGADALVGHESGDQVQAGGVSVTLIHTPGHTPGSQCLLVEQKLLSGDTLFLEGCGRTDLPGADPQEMYVTLSQRLNAISDDTILYPGHFYASEPSAAMGEVRATNFVLAPSTPERWLAMFA
ncbi:MAG: MBL fold metallo-hydrolase [Acidimicrobiales bacterium]|jgi:glyoxylase-like metal-dependent hydrolase (beta-lactamase superfamily II)